MSATPGRGNGAAEPSPLEFFTGFVVLAAVVATALLVAWRSGAFERMQRDHRLAVTWFHSVGALREQEQVVFKGYPIGEVTDVTYDPATRLMRVTMLIDAAFRPPERAVARIEVASMSALSAYIAISDQDLPTDTTELVRGDLRVAVRDGVVEFDAVDPLNTGTLLSQGSYFLDLGGRMTEQFFEGAAADLASWETAVGDPALRETLHGGAARARATTDEVAGQIRGADASIGRAVTAARNADRWLADREETIARSVERAEATTREVRAWIEPFTANPALVER